MKIGIITFHWSDNYGAVMQVYALQQHLISAGHDVCVIDYRPPGIVKNTPLLKRIVGKSLTTCLRKWAVLIRTFRFEKFRKTALKLSPVQVVDVLGLNRVSEGFDILITGSDQVWNPKFLANQRSFDAYFLNFGPDSAKRISYAASIGHSSIKTVEPWKAVLAEKLKAMDAISVRENTGSTIISDITGENRPVIVADPTLLLDKDAHRNRTSRKKRHTKKPKLFSYILHKADLEAEPVIQSVAKEFGLAVSRCSFVDESLLNTKSYLSPDQWLSCIDEANFVVTNSFHALVFCLIFHTPFAVISVKGDKSTMNTRVTELLDRVSLKERLLSSGMVDLALLSQKINWDKVDNEIDIFKKDSESFLEKNLQYQYSSNLI